MGSFMLKATQVCNGRLQYGDGGDNENERSDEIQ